MTRPAYDSFLDLGYPSGAVSVSSTSHSTSTSPSRTSKQYPRGRDQQIFRRAGSDEHGGNENGFHGKNTGAVSPKQWPMLQQRQQAQSPGFGSRDPRNSSIDWPDASNSPGGATYMTSQKQQAVPQQQLRHQTSPTIPQYASLRNISSLPAVHTRSSPANITTSTTTSQTMMNNSKSHNTPHNKFISSSERATTSSTQPPLKQNIDSSGGGGVVTKLVSLFSNKSSSQESSAANGTVKTSPFSRLNASAVTQSSNPQSSGVQFQNHSISTAHQNAQYTKPTSAITYPPVSPARSNTQSSVSGGDSSYNPTGWPGTVDKRGKTYTMEPSYSVSESEEGSSMGSPRNRMYNPNQQYNYPTQQTNRVVNKDVSFDGGDSQAELEDWISSDAASVSKRSSGPIDLDEAFEQRTRFSSGWRKGHEESLTNILENRTAADLHLDTALRNRNNGSDGRRDGTQHHLSRPYQLSQSRTVAQDAVSNLNSPHSVSSPLDEESKRRGIDTSFSEERIRASGKNVTPRNVPTQHRMVHDKEVDFVEWDDEVEFGYSPDDIHVARESFHDQYPHQPGQQYDDEVDFDNFNTRSQSLIQPPTEEALRLNNSRSAPPRPGGSLALKGYRGFIDKTSDVPNLMDDLDSEANTSLGTNTERRALGLSLPPQTKPSFRNSNNTLSQRPSSVASSNVGSGSDVFEGLDSSVPSTTVSAVSGTRLAAAVNNNLTRVPNSFVSEYESFDPKYKQMNNPFRQNQPGSKTLQTINNFDRKADFVDVSLNLSAVTRGSIDGFSHHELVDLDDFIDDSFAKAPDLSVYCVEPESIRLMVRAFRKMCTMQMETSSCEDTILSDFEDLVDTKKRFALFEMRSRIMETDIDRGLQRRGGTNIVDDIVLTPYFQAMHRVRDAVIVSKAWRDGATPKDVITAHLLTRRSRKSYFVRRSIQQMRTPGVPSYPQYWLEEVTWLDDTDFSMMRCPSLGAGTMKGFEMFTIGDCQSILLKMTSENCTQLRRELRSAMMCQIEAEEVMQEEIDLDGDQFVVAEAEQLYRDATVEVKRLSMKLVLADKAFSLVRSRMEKMVETIESLLVRLENDLDEQNDASTSTEDHDDADDDFVNEEQERGKLLERAKRAEMSAEIAIRETLLAKQEAEQIKSDKQREIDDLKDKLAEMETQSQHLASRYSSFMASSSYLDRIDAKSILEGSFDRDMIDARQAARDRAKLKFRERRAIADSGSTSQDGSSRQSVNRGEEMYQSLDFYSRSLNSVQKTAR